MTIPTDGSYDPQKLAEIFESIQTGRLPNFRKILPMFFRLENKPYNIDQHFYLEPMFATHLPEELTVMSGRQVGKSRQDATKLILLAAVIPGTTCLVVTPQYELIRRFSSNYVRPMISESPLQSMLLDTTSSKSVLQRSFANGSSLIFSFAYLSPDRTRGVPASICMFDEFQDMEPSFYKIITASMSASKIRHAQKTGTPKSLSSALEIHWQDSSQAEFIIRCRTPGCGHWNIPRTEFDLHGMIGPPNDDICEDRPGLVCAKCRKPVNPRREGRWEHRFPDRRMIHAGYHIPQVIAPLHYADADNWGIFYRDYKNRSQAYVYNELLGESVDSGQHLVTLTHLRAVSVLNKNTIEAAQEVLKSPTKKYSKVILSVDWGGGGAKRISYTTMAAMGLRRDGKGTDCFLGFRCQTNDPIRQAMQALQLASAIKASHIVHDFALAGDLREQFFMQRGWPKHRLVPMRYVRSPAGPIWRQIDGDEWQPRTHVQLDKARLLALVCEQIRSQKLLFFADQLDISVQELERGAGETAPSDIGLLRDFLVLVEEKRETMMGSDTYTIIRDQKSNSPDDFAQAVAMGCAGLWQLGKAWPRVADSYKYEISKLDMELAEPGNPDWK